MRARAKLYTQKLAANVQTSYQNSRFNILGSLIGLYRLFCFQLLLLLYFGHLRYILVFSFVEDSPENLLQLIGGLPLKHLLVLILNSGDKRYLNTHLETNRFVSFPTCIFKSITVTVFRNLFTLQNMQNAYLKKCLSPLLCCISHQVTMV